MPRRLFVALDLPTPAVPRAWTTRFLADTAGLCSDAIPVERFVLNDSRTRDGVTEHAVEAAFPLGQRDREAGLPW